MLREDAQKYFPKGVPLFFYHSDNDDVVPFAHEKLFSETFQMATVREIAGRGHQFDNDLAEVAKDIFALDNLA